MGVRLIEAHDGLTALYCSTSMTAFGPIFEDGEQAEDFLDWLEIDARKLSPDALMDTYSLWHDLSFNDQGEFDPERRERTVV